MPSPFLLVPVAVEALVVNEADQHATAWSIAPKQYAKPSLFESIEPPPFTESNGQPLPGVTLHWALPDGLTRGRRDSDGSMVFPTVPNRWLVVRLAKISRQNSTDATNATTVARVIESDFLGSQSDGGSNLYPDATGTDVTFLGRKRTLDEFTPGSSRRDRRLTALGLADGSGKLIGAADPAFAAYVANIDNVFSFRDDLQDLGGDIENKLSLSYMVMGWYDSPLDDPLNIQTQFNVLPDKDVTGKPIGKSWSSADEWLTVMKFFGWSVGDGKDLQVAVSDASPHPPANATARDLYPSLILCHGMVYDVKWTGLTLGEPQPFLSGADSPFAEMAVQTRRLSRENQSAEPGRTELPQIAVGNSIVDALASMMEYLLHLDNSNIDLATLFQALEYGLLTNYDQPGGSSELNERIHQEWFSSVEGGSFWEIIAAKTDPPGSPSFKNTAQPVTLTDEQSLGLSALNVAQKALDDAQRLRHSRQLDLYTRLWRSTRLKSLGVDPPLVQRTAGMTAEEFYDLRNATTRTQHAIDDVTQKTSDLHQMLQQMKGSAATASQAAIPGLLGTALQLKENKMPRFWRPADPVMVIYGARRSSKHGGDDRFTDDDTLFCRFSGQEVQSVQVDPTDPSKGTFTAPAGFFSSILSAAATKFPAPVQRLLSELVLLNPSFVADLVPSLTPQQKVMIGTIQRMIWADFSDVTSIAAVHRAAGFSGVRPSPVAIEAWAQPWAPLFLSWRVTWFPTNPDPAHAMDEWEFNGRDFDWTGLGKLDESAAQIIEGRSILSSASTESITKNLKDHLADTEADLMKQIQADPSNAALTRKRQDLAILRDRLTGELESGDLLAQPLTGFHDQLIMRDRTQYYNPPRDTDTALLTALKDGPRLAPIPHHYGTPNGLFYPIRAGHIRLDQIWIVDGFGQVFDPILESGEVPLSFTPVRGSGLVTTGLTQRTDFQALQLPPRILQPARLQFRFVDAAKGDGNAAVDTTLDALSNPVCGWLLPNHLDHSIAVFNDKGISLGAVLLSGDPQQPLQWEKTIAGPDAVENPAVIDNPRLNPHLKAFIKQLFQNTDAGAAFTDLMAAIDSTLWTTEPLGKRGDNLSVLIGRPIALVRARLLMELGEVPATSQLWENNALDGDTSALKGEKAKFPVRLGHVDLRDDGTLGYFAPAAAGAGSSVAYSTFLAVHPKLDLTQLAPSRYVQDAATHGDLKLRVDAPVDVTLLLDPRGSVHARCGILPSKALRVPSRYVKSALEKMNVTFRVGPLLNEPGSLRMPLPVNVVGSWSWIARTGVSLNPNLDDPMEIIPTPPDAQGAPLTITAASQDARLPDNPIHIREGYLKLNDAVAR